MLEKDPGNPKIHRLRTIHLYEWEFNLLLCVKWRQLLHHVCDNQLINKAAYGTMPGCSSLDPVFIQELEYEISRMTRRPLIHFDNDATSCYDRIPCFLANLASRKYGMHKKVCILQARTLEHAKYYLKTKFGISSEYAEHTRECPWFGTGQGSGNSPFYWLLISSTLYDLYCSKTGGGATYVSPDKTLQLTIHLLGFVDDVKNRTGLDPAIDTTELDSVLVQLVHQATQDSQLWHDILTAANQELELSKCKYHFIHWDFNTSTGAPTLQIEQDPANPQHPLTIQGKGGHPVKIQCVPSNKAIKYLGCHKCIDNQMAQRKVLQAKCDDYARVLNCSHLSTRGARVFYQAIYRLSVGYPLPLTYFSKKELDRIQAKAHTATVTKCGFNRNTKKAVLYGPEYLGGAGFFHLHDEQGYGQLATFIKFWRSPHTQAGQMLRIAVAWAQYTAGSGDPIFHDPTKIPHLEARWLSSMREYLVQVNGHLELDDPMVPPKLRENDRYIMDLAMESQKFKPYQLRMINYCRLYLRAVTVADIATANGTHVLDACFHGEEDGIICNSQWSHVHQKRPGASAWKCWRSFCRLLCDPHMFLCQRLGPWIVPRTTIRRHWQYWHSRSERALHEALEDGTFIRYPQMFADFDRDRGVHGVASLPAVAVPVDGFIPAPGIIRILPHYNQWQLPSEAPPLSSDLLQHCSELPEWERELLQNLQLEVPQDDLFQILQKEKMYIATDGSCQDGMASFGWTLSTLEGQRLAKCSGPAFGAQLNSYRAEGYGLLSIFRFLHHLRTTFNLRLLDWFIWCDNKSMVGRASSQPRHLDRIYPNTTLDAEWDILMEIWRTNSSIPREQRPQLGHVKGHQDAKKPYSQLPLNAQLNCDADALADSYLQQNPNRDYRVVPMIPASRVQLHLPQGTVTCKLKLALKLARHTQPLKQHMKERFDWSDEVLENIDWECSRRAFNWNKSHQITLIKHANKITPVGRRVHRYDPKYNPACASCQDPEEDYDHVHTCQSPSRTELKVSIQRRLRKSLEDWNTMPPLRDLLLEGLASVLEDRPLRADQIDASVQVVAQSQSSIGWSNILRGRMSRSWAEFQQIHLGAFQPKNNGQTWCTKVIDALLKGWLELWKLRNQDRHGKDRKTRLQAERDQAIRELEQLYAMKDTVHPTHQWLFDTPLQQRLNLKTYYIRAFISNWKPVLLQERDHQTQLETG